MHGFTSLVMRLPRAAPGLLVTSFLGEDQKKITASCHAAHWDRGGQHKINPVENNFINYVFMVDKFIKIFT